MTEPLKEQQNPRPSCVHVTGAFTASIMQTVHHKYYVILTAMTWPDAQNYCRAKYNDLATIVSDEDWVKVKNELGRNNVMSRCWTGLYNDINSWRWSLNNVLLSNITLKKWNPGEPDNAGGRQSCAAMDPVGNWSDQTCSDTMAFICYNSGNTGADRFIGVSSPLMSWTEAQTYCRTFHTDLASAFNQTDNDLLQQVTSTQGSSWMGLFRDTWKWSDRTIPNNLRWRPGLPDNYYRNDNCGTVYNGVFIDLSCSRLYYFVCHGIVSVRKQQVRLQVKSAGGVFDSAVLELVKQKLEEHGMLENTTVTWRVQPDGNIFHKKKKG
ncbi:macrophage mannose receptor 1-like isoform X2 [Hemibagrus wyckioides]|uniref:macrophage mannose receptor 1-like isoform X2 n=1 Tax=Hemibagrus wyckioides TaxID=337641 RepID=UPI00266BBC2A|nr:macrophage mannose receptor 1-like isoform X2 [Hemibagrus wyckioides]